MAEPACSVPIPGPDRLSVDSGCFRGRVARQSQGSRGGPSTRGTLALQATRCLMLRPHRLPYVDPSGWGLATPLGGGLGGGGKPALVGRHGGGLMCFQGDLPPPGEKLCDWNPPGLSGRGTQRAVPGLGAGVGGALPTLGAARCSLKDWRPWAGSARGWAGTPPPPRRAACRSPYPPDLCPVTYK